MSLNGTKRDAEIRALLAQPLYGRVALKNLLHTQSDLFIDLKKFLSIRKKISAQNLQTGPE